MYLNLPEEEKEHVTSPSLYLLFDSSLAFSNLVEVFGIDKYF